MKESNIIVQYQASKLVLVEFLQMQIHLSVQTLYSYRHLLLESIGVVCGIPHD